MVKAGKAEAGSDPLAKVTKFYVWFDFYKIDFNLCDSCNGYMIFFVFLAILKVISLSGNGTYVTRTALVQADVTQPLFRGKQGVRKEGNCDGIFLIHAARTLVKQEALQLKFAFIAFCLARR